MRGSPWTFAPWAIVLAMGAALLTVCQGCDCPPDVVYVECGQHEDLDAGISAAWCLEVDGGAR